jgi:lysophospholipase L1-like esterase
MDSNPDIVIIMLGSNDTKTLNWTDTRKTQFRTSYLELVRGFMNLPSAPQVYLATPVPVIWTSLRGIRESVLAEEIRPIIREVATELELPLIENEGLLPGGQGYYLVDRLHPSSKGYDLLSTHIMNSILAGGKL